MPTLLLGALVVIVTLCVVAGMAPAEGRARRGTAAARTARSARASTRAFIRRPTSQTAARLAGVRAQRAKTALRVKAATAERERVRVALRDLNANVQSQTAAVGNARIAASTAARDATGARAEERRTEQQLAALGAARRRAVLAAYIRPPSTELVGLLSTDGINDSAKRDTLRSVVGRQGVEIIDQVRSLEEDLTDVRARAVRLSDRASAKRKAYEARLRRLKGARTNQIEYATTVEDQLERNLSEAESLRVFDSSLSKKLDAENLAWARQLVAARVSGSRNGASGSIAIPRDIPTGSTHGIVVAAALRPKLAAMLDAARRDGIFLTGGGYRSPTQQVVLRRAHCGSSSFAVYQMRASQCRPPTARPGASMHERGLAVDFRDQYSSGSLTRSSPGYRWLRANAARFGFRNLPSEPWHWSINGR